MSGVDKAAVLRDLDAAWEDLGAAVDSAPEGELEQPGVVDGWSVKDLLGHIAFWADKAARDLELLMQGGGEEIEAPGGAAGTDEWNDREYRKRKELPLSQVRTEWEQSYRDARAALDAAPAELLEQVVKGYTTLLRFAGDTFSHYREHAAQIRAWQRQLETSET